MMRIQESLLPAIHVRKRHVSFEKNAFYTSTCSHYSGEEASTAVRKSIPSAQVKQIQAFVGGEVHKGTKQESQKSDI